MLTLFWMPCLVWLYAERCGNNIGFGFHGNPRTPFDSIVTAFEKTRTPIVAVDIPSGWNVMQGPGEHAYSPFAVVSLTAPKPCAHYYQGRHFLGGRFVPP